MDDLTKTYDAQTGGANTPPANTSTLMDAYNSAANNGVSAAESLRNAYTANQTQNTQPNTPQPTPVATPAAEAAVTPAAATPAAAASPTDALQPINGYLTNDQRIQSIKDMYAAQQQARLNELENAYNLSMSDMQAAAEKIPQQFQTQANANAVDYERQRRNALEQFNMNGLNTGANSQYQLSMMGNNQRTMNNIRQAQASSEAEAARQQANLTAPYQSNIASAIANNDYQKAAALLDEYNNAYERDLKNAGLLAEYGDFSGYAGLYGQDVADGMAAIWYQQNPDVAYVTGKITKDQRDNIKAGRPINDGLDANGKRIKPLKTGGGGISITDYTGFGAGVPLDFSPTRYPNLDTQLQVNAPSRGYV